MLSDPEKVADRLEEIVERSAVEFGVDITPVELTDVQVPQDLIEDIGAQAQEQRERDARVAEVERITLIADIAGWSSFSAVGVERQKLSLRTERYTVAKYVYPES